ncbi:MAG: hypothetical protein E6G53_01535, partial [Actinobacteria bacterium]
MATTGSSSRLPARRSATPARRTAIEPLDRTIHGRAALAAIAAVAICGVAVVENGAAAARAPRPDLVATEASAAPTVRHPGDALTVSDRVANAGNAKAARSVAGFYLVRQDRRIRIGGRTVRALRRGTHSDGTTTVRLSRTLAGGTYRLQVCADDSSQVRERREHNNCTSARASVLITLDRTRPTSVAGAPAFSRSRSTQVRYTADGTGSALARVELYVEPPGATAFQRVATDSAPASGHHFTYVAQGADGPYRFYTLAYDVAGNSELPPAGADATTTLDTFAPTSAASAPVGTKAASIQVGYTADGTGSPLARVELWVKGPGDIGFTKAQTDAAPGPTGHGFTYFAGKGDGDYSFYTLAYDQAGNVEAAPGSPDATTAFDTTAPALSCASADSAWHAQNVSLPCTASDSGSGLANQADASFSLTTSVAAGSQSSNAATGSRQVCDVAGNCSTAGPIGGNKVDRTTPQISCAAADSAWHAQNVSLPCTASDSGSGLANQADASFSLTTSVAAGSQSSNAATGSRQVCDVAGNCSTAGPIGGNKVDRATPQISCAAADSAWHAQNVSLGCTASDTGSGLAASADASFSLTTSVAAGTENANAPTASHQVCDVVGNCATGGPIAGNKVDRKPPTSSASAPASSASPVRVDYTAADTGSGLGKVELYVKRPGDSAFAKVATDTAPGSSGHFDYAPSAGDGSYGFYTIAYDAAGNAEAAPTSADATTSVDVTAPRVTVTQPANGSTTDLMTFSGATGTASGDVQSVTVRIFSGSTEVQTLSASVSGGSWTATASPVPDGTTYTARAEQKDAVGNLGQATSTFTVPTTLLAAGDIAGDPNTGGTGADTATLVEQRAGTVATLGDNVYENGTASEFSQWYAPFWGTFKSRTMPAPGNREYNTSGATGYFGYFGTAAGDPSKGYYSYDRGSWHIIVLNSSSDCPSSGIACTSTSAQGQWLAADLAAHSNTCTLAYWHHPLVSSSTSGFTDTAVRPLFQALY